MSRPGAWGRVWTLFKKSLTQNFTEKKIIGEDSFGNKYYEIIGTRSNVKRGYIPASDQADPPILEWEMWLKGTRKHPPTQEEIELNKLKQEAQLVQHAKLEKAAPRIETRGPGAGDAGPKPFPKYKDLEQAPGVTISSKG